MIKNNQYVKDTLDGVIEEMALNKESFVKNPGKDFIRNRKISFQVGCPVFFCGVWIFCRM